MYTKKEREYYNQHRANVCERLNITKNQYNWFRRKGQAIHTILENYCNGYEDKTKEAEDEREEQVLTDAVEAECHNLGIYGFFQTDPRGATIYLDKSPITQMNYTNTSCIY